MTERRDTDWVIRELAEKLDPIGLDEMVGLRLMNRMDMKFVTCRKRLEQLLEMARGSYRAQLHEGTRLSPYMTTYWDTGEHLFYLQHHNGRTPRQKVRVRTYVGEEMLTFLEVKTKNNHGRTGKKRVRVAGQDDVTAAADFVAMQVGHSLGELHPTLRNHFRRLTLVNCGMTERLTIDMGICFDNLETQDHVGTGELVVIELKRDGAVASPVLEMLRSLRVKPLGFSKYCIGSVMTNPSLKHNEFKPRLTEIDHQVHKIYY